MDQPDPDEFVSVAVHFLTHRKDLHRNACGLLPENILDHGPGSFQNLEYPVTVDGTTYTTLTMRRPKVRDERDARRDGGGPVDQELRLFGNLCEVAPAVMEELDAADYDRLQDVYFDFFPVGSRRRL